MEYEYLGQRKESPEWKILLINLQVAFMGCAGM